MNATAKRRHVLNIRTGAIIMIATAIWAATASSLSAHGLISVATEVHSYFLSFLLCCTGAFLVLYDQAGLTMQGLYRLAFSGFFVLVVVLFWLGLGAKVFVYWKARAIPQEEWNQMRSDLENLFNKRAKEELNGGWMFGSESVPESLKKLGLQSDCRGGFACLNFAGHGEKVVYVYYGSKNRTWGLWVGSRAMAELKFSKCKIVAVAADAFLFFGKFD